MERGWPEKSGSAVGKYVHARRSSLKKVDELRTDMAQVGQYVPVLDISEFRRIVQQVQERAKKEALRPKKEMVEANLRSLFRLLKNILTAAWQVP